MEDIKTLSKLIWFKIVSLNPLSVKILGLLTIFKRGPPQIILHFLFPFYLFQRFPPRILHSLRTSVSPKFSNPSFVFVFDWTSRHQIKVQFSSSIVGVHSNRLRHRSSSYAHRRRRPMLVVVVLCSSSSSAFKIRSL